MARVIWDGPKPGQKPATLHVTFAISRRYSLRLRIARLLIRLAAHIAHFGFQEHEQGDSSD